jgi:hypothetical protein
VLRKRVLVVDGTEETELVLRAALEPRGLAVDRIRSDQPPADDLPPRVIVLHDASATAIPNCSDWELVPRIIVGSAKVAEPASPQKQIGSPFHYRDLINAIQVFLDDAA